MIHNLPVDDEDQTIICQIDFANAFQTPSRQLGTNDFGLWSRYFAVEQASTGPIKRFR